MRSIFPRTSAAGWAIRWVIGKATRWSIDTTNFTDKTRFRGSTENLHVVERFTRMDDKTLLYRFTVEDPETGIGRGPVRWPGRPPISRFYEYACHEGNYALGDVMRGARKQEAEEAAAKPQK